MIKKTYSQRAISRVTHAWIFHSQVIIDLVKSSLLYGLKTRPVPVSRMSNLAQIPPTTSRTFVYPNMFYKYEQPRHILMYNNEPTISTGRKDAN
jgi:hypothetical protein